MKPLFGFIISTDNRYNNTIDVEGKELIMNTEITERDFEFVNRVGTVEAVPRFNESNIKPGDLVIVHHNVFRRWYDVRGNEKNGGSFLEEGKYICFPDQIFGYNDGSWKATDGYCFVSPIESDDIWDVGLEKPHIGTLVYKGDDLDISIGSRVGFKKGSEYEFVIDGQKLYRVLSNNINIEYDRLQETKGKNYKVITDSVNATG